MFGLSHLKNKKYGLLAFMLLTSISSFAQEKTDVATTIVSGYDMLRYTLLTVAGLLVLVIWILSNTLKVTARIYTEKQKKQQENSIPKQVLSLVALVLASGSAWAQPAEPVARAAKNGLPWDIYIYFFVVGLELLTIFFLARTIYTFLRVKKEKATINFLQKLTKPIPVEEEHKLDLHHDYDGIRELDNNIPGWWQISFFGTFIFGLIYLYRMFGAETLPRQIQELAMANTMAAEQKAAYLENQSNNVDEKTVKMLDAAGIASGQALFGKNCVACHGDKGQGGVGPNLTDEYWLHKGSIKDIFYSIKYGWQEKGMRSWKDDFSPVQMAQISSFVSSIQNTNVPGGKEKQGELYTPELTEATDAAVTDVKK